MIAKGVKAHFETKIPGGVQYSSLLLGFEVEADLEEGETLSDAIDELVTLLREKAKFHLRPMKGEQRQQIQEVGNGVPAAAVEPPPAEATKTKRPARKPDPDDLDFDTGLPFGEKAAGNGS